MIDIPVRRECIDGSADVVPSVRRSAAEMEPVEIFVTRPDQ